MLFCRIYSQLLHVFSMSQLQSSRIFGAEVLSMFKPSTSGVRLVGSLSCNEPKISGLTKDISLSSQVPVSALVSNELNLNP